MYELTVLFWGVNRQVSSACQWRKVVGKTLHFTPSRWVNSWCQEIQRRYLLETLFLLRNGWVRSKMDKHEAQPHTRELCKHQKEKAPQKGASDTVRTWFFNIIILTILGTWWRATRGSNPGPLVPETNALSTELVAHEGSDSIYHSKVCLSIKPPLVDSAINHL